MLADATDNLSAEAKQAYNTGESEAVLFADDTLVLSQTSTHLEDLMKAVEVRGADYGLQIHWAR